ncbi:Endonuclease-reverse transcriptase [Popillia japonica]|uniref:Endonuclease-reverse transcriptase n=1 Tax=Popillia japonica TaxID=7064 RepID=A0AAW1KKY8_POPJA
MLYATVCENDIDIVLISEPNVKISLYHNYLLDKQQNVAVYIKNKNVGIQSFSLGEGYICIKWERWCMYACYCSPNIPLDDFKAFIDALANDIRATGLDAVVAGDFNSKSPMWGSPITDARGELLVEWAAEVGLNALNLGDEPTFERGNSKSHIDITWANEAMTRHIHEWTKNKRKELLNELENYIWADGYKIIMRRLGRLSPPYRSTTSQQMTIVKELFQTETQELRDSNQTAERVPAFLKEEEGAFPDRNTGIAGL